MALLYSLLDATAQDDPEFGHIEAGPDGAFPFSDELSDRLHRVHHRGRKAWETQAERQARLHGEDLARRRDPAALYDAVGEFSGALRQFAGMAAGASPDAAAEIAELRRQLAELQAAQAPAAASPAKVPAAPAAKAEARAAGGK